MNRALSPLKGKYRINPSYIGFHTIISTPWFTAATKIAANAHGAPHAGNEEDNGTRLVGQRVVCVVRSRMSVTDVCWTNMIIPLRICF